MSNQKKLPNMHEEINAKNEENSDRLTEEMYCGQANQSRPSDFRRNGHYSQTLFVI